eukprot:1138705-Alexandrium_andersonii.AAC.1
MKSSKAASATKSIFFTAARAGTFTRSASATLPPSCNVSRCAASPCTTGLFRPPHARPTSCCIPALARLAHGAEAFMCVCSRSPTANRFSTAPAKSQANA